MNVRVYDAERDDTIAFYGISDFEVTDEGVYLRAPITTDDERFEDDGHWVEGHVVSAVDSQSYNRAGLLEAVQIDADRDDEVVLVDSDEYSCESLRAHIEGGAAASDAAGGV